MAKRTGLGRGIGALIPTADQAERPVDVFFPGASLEKTPTTAPKRPRLFMVPPQWHGPASMWSPGGKKSFS